MSSLFLAQITKLLDQVADREDAKLESASRAMAESLIARRAVYFYGSGHSTLPTLDVFPRYGSFVGLQPIYDPRLTWSNVLGPGGVRELLWLERQEGYVQNVLKSYPLGRGDTLVVYSHGGVNAAPVEAALLGRDRGATVIAVTSLSGIAGREATHSSGKRLADAADICIDTHAPSADVLVEVEGLARSVGASSTVLSVAITMELITRTARRATEGGLKLDVFQSPVASDGSGNDFVFESYASFANRLRIHSI